MGAFLTLDVLIPNLYFVIACSLAGKFPDLLFRFVFLCKVNVADHELKTYLVYIYSAKKYRHMCRHMCFMNQRFTYVECILLIHLRTTRVNWNHKKPTSSRNDKHIWTDDFESLKPDINSFWCNHWTKGAFNYLGTNLTGLKGVNNWRVYLDYFKKLPKASVKSMKTCHVSNAQQSSHMVKPFQNKVKQKWLYNFAT